MVKPTIDVAPTSGISKPLIFLSDLIWGLFPLDILAISANTPRFHVGGQEPFDKMNFSNQAWYIVFACWVKLLFIVYIGKIPMESVF